MKVSDKIVVLRDGERIAETRPSETTIDMIAELMVGRRIEGGEIQGRPLAELSDEPVLEIKGLSVAMPGESVKGVDLDVRRGEILGIAGLAGQGKIGIANGIMGLFPSSGDVRMNGEPVRLNSPRTSLDNRMAFVSEDRRGTGLLLDESIEFNMVATAIQTKGMFMKTGRVSILNSREMTGYAREMIEKLDIRCTGPRQLARRLSGGNQQKVCIARAITLEPSLLFVSEPTRGIDIGAKRLILDHWCAERGDRTTQSRPRRSCCALARAIAIVTGRLEGVLLPTASDRDFGLMMAGEYAKLHGKEAV